MFVLIWSLLGLSCVHSSLGVGFLNPQSVPPFSTFPPSAYQLDNSATPFNQPANQFNQPANQFNQPANQFNQPANQFNQPANQFNQPANQFNQPANPFNQPAVQFPSPGNTNFDTVQPNFQVPNYFQGLDTPPSQPRYIKDPSQCKFADAVKNFERQFVQSISSSQRYKDAFDLQRVSKERASSIWYERIRDESVAAGEKDPDFSAFTNARAVRDNYENIDSDYQLKVFGFSLGEYLYQKRVLTADNVNELSEKLAQTMRGSIDENGSNATAEDDLYAILQGCERFLRSLNSEDLSYACDAIFGELFYIMKNC